MDNNQPSQIISPDSQTEPQATEPATEPLTPSSEAKDQPQPPMAPLPGSKPGKSKKKLFIILAVVIGLAAIGGAVWYFVLRDKEQPVQTSQQERSEVTEEAKTFTPENVAYAYRDSDTSPYKIYYRSADGGERVEVGPLGDKSYVSQYAVSGQHVAYSTDNESEGSAEKAIWHSSDSGKTYSKLIDLKSDEQVTSMIFSVNGDSLAVAVLPEGTDSNTVKLIDTNTKKVTSEVEVASRGVFLEGYSSEKSEIIFFEGCYNCDGAGFTHLKRMNLRSKDLSTVVNAVDDEALGVKVKPDFSEVLVQSSKINSAGNEMPSYGAPYSIYTVSMTDGKKTDLVTLTGDNGSLLRQIGYTSDNQLPYYLFNNSINVHKNGQASKVYETDKTVDAVHYLSDSRSIIYSGGPEGYSLFDIDLESKASKVILNGDNGLMIFGVTTK